MTVSSDAPSVSPQAVTNISCYKFATLTDLKSLRERLLNLCKAGDLKGTILLSPEGINMFVAGARAHIDRLVDEVRSIPGLEGLTPKISESAEQPFRRMLVRLKKEIIAFGVEGIEPARYTSPRLEARTLKQWLDEGRPVVLLDTRNDYEVKLGTFKGAIPIGVDHFRDFPEAVRKLPAHLKHQPIVTFCTGGIRCEKAAPFMEREGFEQIYQLEGGILKYFEEVGGDYYDGECFVFDQRVGVDPSLHETESSQCFVCQSPLSEADQKDARYVQSVSCPYCYKTSVEQMHESIAARQAVIAQVTSPLPGSIPYDNYRPVSIPESCEGLTLLDSLCVIFPHMPRTEWLQRLENGRFFTRDHQPVSGMQPVRAGDQFLQRLPATVEPDVNPDIRILHEDEALIVVHKPAPLPMHPSGRFNRNTLHYILNQVYEPQKLRPAHRLDSNTTGLVVIARTRHFAGMIQQEFARGGVEKLYLARVQGHPPEETFSCAAPISSVPGSAGSREIDEEDGQDALTEFRVVSRDSDGTALLEARPITGRTNQIRVHLWQLGFPIQGDPVYLPNQKLGDTQTLPVEAASLCLHSWRLTFTHPLTKTRLQFETEPPAWAAPQA